MLNKSKIVLVGGGGHCGSVIDVIETTKLFDIVGIVDMKNKLNLSLLGYKVIATDDDISALVKEYPLFFVTIGQIKSAEVRRKLFNMIIKAGGQLPVIKSPYSRISNKAKLGMGCIVMHQAMVNTSTFIGANCIINSGAIIEHDVIVGDHCHVSTGAIVNGGVKVGGGSFIGSGSIINQGISIAEDTIIASASLINRDTLANKVYAGIPAQCVGK